MERVLSKEQIMELYLNEIYLGNGSYGIASASLNYFNKSVTDLKVHEMAKLKVLVDAMDAGTIAGFAKLEVMQVEGFD